MLEVALASAIREGQIAGLTLYPTLDGRWQASVTRDRVSWRVELSDDPTDALVRVLTPKVYVLPQDQGIFG